MEKTDWELNQPYYRIRVSDKLLLLEAWLTQMDNELCIEKSNAIAEENCTPLSEVIFIEVGTKLLRDKINEVNLHDEELWEIYETQVLNSLDEFCSQYKLELCKDWFYDFYSRQGMINLLYLKFCDKYQEQPELDIR